MAMASPASCCLLLFLIFLCIHHSLAAAASPFSFSFDFTNRYSYNQSDLKLEGDATWGAQEVDVTCNSRGTKPEGCAGRVSYAHPVPFYDNSTGEVASFQTRFTFAIVLTEGTMKGDGMAFFLACYPSAMPNASGEGNLGLITDGKRTAYGNERFIAVEFDTYNNTFEQPSTTMDHIGIDINSVMHSENTTSLPDFRLNGSMTATVTFDNTTRMLVADLQFNDDRNYRVTKELPDPVTLLLPPQVSVGFSADTGTAMELHHILSWSFNSSLAPPHKGGNHKKEAVFVGGSIGGVVAFLVVGWCVISYFHLRRKSTSHDLLKRLGARRFEYHVLAASTNDFSKKLVIGQGKFGVVYKGTFSRDESLRESSNSKESANKVEMAVKKMKNDTVGGGNRDFFAEMNTISEVRHKNLVKLKGWCCRENSRRNLLDFMCWCCRKKKDDELFLVYELVPNHDLHYHLHKSEQGIAWPIRYKIVKGIGSALVYLHHDCVPYIQHRDIKPGNILLDNDFNAKLADFGLSRIGNQDNATLATLAVGTEGYMDPECRKHGDVKFYPRSDVYSFGIVLLNIVCTRKPREQVWELYTRGKVIEAVDERLHADINDDSNDRRQMERVAVLGLWCSLPYGANRPTVQKVMEVLESEDPLPNLNYLVNTRVPLARHDT